ncbi:MAG: SLC5 family protein [Thermoguttaceae bacterium]
MNLSLAGLDIWVFVVYMLAVLAVGAVAARRGQQTKRDYFLSGDKLPWWMIGGSIVASNISSHHLVGVMGIAYHRGFISMVIEWGAILIGFNALLWIFLPFYLRNGFYTMPEFLEKRFGTAARTVYAALVLLTYVFVEVSAVLYLGGLAIHSLLDIDIMWSVIVLALATGAYTIAGGLRAVIWTEMLQLGVLLAGGIVLAFATIAKAGGWSAVVATSSEWHMLMPADDPDFPWTMYLGGVICISVFYCAANQFIVQRTLAAKNEWHARMGVVFADYLKFLIPLVIIVPGLVAPKLYPDLKTPDLVFPTLVENLLSPGLVGLVMAALIAAVMSHVSGAVNSCTTIATIDFYLPFVNKKASEAQAVRFGRLTGVVVILLGIVCAGVLIAHKDRPVFLYLLNAYGYFTPGIATMFLLGIFSKRTTHAGALGAGILTIPLSIALQCWRPGMPFFNRTGIVFWTCMAACAGISLVTKPKPCAELAGLIWNKESLLLPEEQRAGSRGLHSPLLWWAGVTALVLYFYVRFP